jgi:CheY-like chemotaxis protein/HPt (histidine-containing phosphotransfer) domain-containing protein
MGSREDAELNRGRWSGVPVLVVEDSPINQQVAVGTLELLGFRADVVGNGLEALEALEPGAYRAVLMDCQMPVMDGYRAAAEIRRREAGRSRIPIIAMTANAMSGTREQCLAAGMDDYIAKPVRLDELERVLARWLASSGALAPHRDGAGDEPPTPGDVLPVLDPAAIRALGRLRRPDQPDLVVELIDKLLQSTPLQLASLEQSAGSGDVATLRRTAHTIKGDAKYWGAGQVVAASEALERAADRPMVEVAPLIADLAAKLATLRTALEAVRAERSRAR